MVLMGVLLGKVASTEGQSLSIDLEQAGEDQNAEQWDSKERS